ncbi:MAG: tetratricopeptide repeat protein 38 family protein [Phyllobacteriaceae bacterium]|nr:tetratricopeptide repeat protein 38 family protein [Phyllobacteriaceae bacterium]MBA90521.1 tetratricopeptide repeat protein 38 family protein [Phyllobacteriaceae bacterium]
MLDPLGNPLSNASPAGHQGICDFVGGFLGYHPRAVNVLAAAEADPECPLAQTYAGMLWMFLESPEAPVKAQCFINAGAALSARANERERGLHAILTDWASGDQLRAEARIAAHLDGWPNDLVAMKLGQYLAFNRGDAPAMLRLARAVESRNAGNAHFHAMAAFAFEQCHLLDKAEAAANRALEIDEAEPWAHHALAHVMLTQGRVPEGARFLDRAAPHWNGLNSFMYTHNWWHRALFALSMGDEAAVLAMYDEHCWSMEKSYSQDQIGAVSLLARMEMAGMDVGGRWTELAGWLRVRHGDTVNAFLTLQYLYGLKRADLSEAADLMHAIEDRAAGANGFDADVWRDVALPAARAIMAHLEGRHAEAARLMSLALPRTAEAGGSHAQRDLFEQILLDAHRKAGHLVQAQQMMEMRRIYDPCGIPLNRMLAATYRHLGLQEEACEAEARRYA